MYFTPLALPFAVIVANTALAAPAPPAKSCANAYPWFVVTRATLHKSADGPIVRKIPVGTRATIAIRRDGWCEVSTDSEESGWVKCETLDPTWIEVQKSKRRMIVHRGEKTKHYPVHLGYNPIDDKERRGSQQHPEHWRTPEGVFFVCRKLPNSSFYKAFLLSYPNTEDADRGLAAGLISPKQAASIRQHIERRRCPPMNTRLGGAIEIHGNDQPSAGDWTWGCIATTDGVMDELYPQIAVGTPTLVCP